MKKTVTYLFIVFLASLIFYGGAGVNFVTYCCNDCRTEGVAVLLNDNCCEVHGHGCCDTTTEEASCSSGVAKTTVVIWNGSVLIGAILIIP